MRPRSSGTPCVTRTPTSRPRPPPSGRASPTSPSWSRSRTPTSRAQWPRRRGARSRSGSSSCSTSESRPPAPGWRATPRSAHGWPSARPCPGKPRRWTQNSAPSSPTLAGAVTPSGGPSGGDAWQSAIFATAAGLGLPPGRAFAALYLAFLGRPNGPRAGWLLAGLDREFVLTRLRGGRERAGRAGVLMVRAAHQLCEGAAGDATMSPAGGVG